MITSVAAIDGPRPFALDFIRHWEDGGATDPNATHSLDPVDNGNWTGGKQGLGTLVGSNHGVTAAALALHRGVPAASITRATMHTLTVDEAADIALALFFKADHLDLLPWNRVTASVFDMAWGAGPGTAIKLLQRLVGVADDGQAGAASAAAAARWYGLLGEGPAARAYAKARNDYYDRIIAARPANAKYRNGWRARSAYYTPGDAAGWWARAA
ncbi:glycosyl hydrolase 108 family protein [Sphingomonas bacterium]|uniref:glycosyl hydrolase 108 family protein n=1 Tax=Sphingomonas bacterium TaxID=1895847 RepID=UPI001576377F|nr:glycosyl hydrolase 108 family protein [Sphingomonas bacterium]